MNNKKLKMKMKKYRWLIILVITTFIAMYVYGMTEIYLPGPIHLGAGQYIDIATGVIILTLAFSGFLVALIFKDKRNRGK
ncbi:MAG: hypothetical protein ACFFDF_01055 [Candidatus Odinarchaeota archaeon]